MRIARAFFGTILAIGVMSGAHASIVNLGVLSDGFTKFSFNSVAANTAFTDTFNFSLPSTGSINDLFFAAGISGFTVAVDGTNYSGATFGPFTAGVHSFLSLASGAHSLSIFGTGSALGGAYFNAFQANVAAVPEADTWLMLIIGAGLVAFQLRRKQQSLPRRSFAAG